MIPIAISPGFGMIFATLVTLLLVPNLYLIKEDIRKVLRFKSGKPVEVSDIEARGYLCVFAILKSKGPLSSKSLTMNFVIGTRPVCSK